MTQTKFHLPAFLITLLLALSALALFFISLILMVSIFIDASRGELTSASDFISVTVYAFTAILVSVCAWFVGQKAFETSGADVSFGFPFSSWQIPIFLFLVFIFIVIGALISTREILWLSALTLPFLTLPVIILPVWLLVGVGSRNIAWSSRWRTFSILGLGLTLSPFLMLLLEGALLLFFLILAGIYLAMQPELLRQVLNLHEMLQIETNPEAILQLVAPYLLQPAVMIPVILFVAVFVPLIEELLKPLALLFFVKNIELPAQGFALGLISGAAFALLESLNASADASATWGVIVSVRAGTTLLHITASGLVGWGMVTAFRQKKFLRGFAAYIAAVLIHGIWNACALGAGLSTIGFAIGKADWVFSIIPAAIGGMVTLGIGMLLVLMYANRVLTRPVPVESH